MTRFKFALIGSPQAPIVEIDVSGIDELCAYMTRVRFVTGRMVEIDCDGADAAVIIPVSRIQFVTEAVVSQFGI